MCVCVTAEFPFLGAEDGPALRSPGLPIKRHRFRRACVGFCVFYDRATRDLGDGPVKDTDQMAFLDLCSHALADALMKGRSGLGWASLSF